MFLYGSSFEFCTISFPNAFRFPYISQTFLSICVCVYFFLTFYQPPKYEKKQQNRPKKKTIRCFHFPFRFVNISTASHAPQHSLLLLDLDQLVVVSANLDNLTIASSAAYSDSFVDRRSHPISSTTTPTDRSPYLLHPLSSSSIINQSLPHHPSLPIIATSFTATILQPATNIPCDDGSNGFIETSLVDDNTTRRGLFDHFLDSSKFGKMDTICCVCKLFIYL